MYDKDKIANMNKIELLAFIKNNMSLSERAFWVNKPVKTFLDKYDELFRNQNNQYDNYLFDLFNPIFRLLEEISYLNQSQSDLDNRWLVDTKMNDFKYKMEKRLSDFTYGIKALNSYWGQMQFIAFYDNLLAVY